MTIRIVLPAVILWMVAAGLAGCGGGAAHSVFAVKKAMTPGQVVAVAGKPYARGGLYGTNCWFYLARKQGTSIDGVTFCFKGGRVFKVQIAEHL